MSMDNMATTEHSSHQIKRPDWLKVRFPTGTGYEGIKNTLKKLDLVTVCQEALCPNIGECWGGKNPTATFMLMGDTCTRACGFCAVKTGNPRGFLDLQEPFKVGQAISQMALDYVVLTSVDRDDLSDFGAAHFAQTIAVIMRENPKMIVEVLTPDFQAQKDLILKVLKAGPRVFAHNLETVRRLSPSVRDRRASYDISLSTLKIAKDFNNAQGCTQKKQYTKTSLMLGLGEKESEVLEALQDLRKIECDIVTFGQYLAPTARHKKFLPVVEYITPEQFKKWQGIAEGLGFLYVAAKPLARSSYRAGEYFIKGVIESERVFK